MEPKREQSGVRATGKRNLLGRSFFAWLSIACALTPLLWVIVVEILFRCYGLRSDDRIAGVLLFCLPLGMIVGCFQCVFREHNKGLALAGVVLNVVLSIFICSGGLDNITVSGNGSIRVGGNNSIRSESQPTSQSVTQSTTQPKNENGGGEKK